MPCILLFAGGVVLGAMLGGVKKALTPYVATAASKFDTLYAQVGQKAGQTFEDFEDRMAEKRYRAATQQLKKL